MSDLPINAGQHLNEFRYGGLAGRGGLIRTLRTLPTHGFKEEMVLLTTGVEAPALYVWRGDTGPWELIAGASFGATGVGHFDYWIDGAYTGAVGAVVTTAGGSTTKLYSSPKAAVDDANINRQAVGQDTSFFIAGGDYTVAVEIDCNVPNTGWWRFVGEGKSRTTLSATMVTGNLFDLNAVGVDLCGVSFSHMKLTTEEPITLINAGAFGFVDLFEMHLRPHDSGAVGIEVWQGATIDLALQASHCQFGDGTNSTQGKGIYSPGGSAFFNGVQVDNCSFNVGRGIELSLDFNLAVTNCVFSISGSNSGIHLMTGASGPSEGIVITGNVFSGGNGVFFERTGTGVFLGAGNGVTITGNHFNTSGIDCSQDATGGAAGWKNLVVVGNTFSDGGVGIRGLSTAVGGANVGPRNCTIVGNSFEGYVAGNEIRFMTEAGHVGNIVCHNSTDSGTPCPVKNNRVEKGAGPPTHSAAEGVLYWDQTNNILYSNADGAVAWTAIGGGSFTHPRDFEAIVDNIGTGDYTTVQDALNSGARRIFIRGSTIPYAGWDGTLIGTPGYFVQGESAQSVTINSLTLLGSFGYIHDLRFVSTVLVTGVRSTPNLAAVVGCRFEACIIDHGQSAIMTQCDFEGTETYMNALSIIRNSFIHDTAFSVHMAGATVVEACNLMNCSGIALETGASSFEDGQQILNCFAQGVDSFVQGLGEDVLVSGNTVISSPNGIAAAGANWSISNNKMILAPIKLAGGNSYCSDNTFSTVSGIGACYQISNINAMHIINGGSAKLCDQFLSTAFAVFKLKVGNLSIVNCTNVIDFGSVANTARNTWIHNVIIQGGGASYINIPAGESIRIDDMKQTEVDFGAVPVDEALFVVSDPNVPDGAFITGCIAYEAPTDKDLDELEMDAIDLKFGADTNTVNIYAKGLEGPLHDKFKINYVVATS